MKDPSKVTTQAPFLAPYLLQKTKSIQPKTWPPNTPGAPLAGEQVPGERWGLQPALDPGCVAAADAPRPLRVENGETDPCSGGGGGSREVVPATRSALGVRRAAWARPRPPPPTVHAFIRTFVRSRVAACVYAPCFPSRGLGGPRSWVRSRLHVRPPLVPPRGGAGPTPLPVTWPADRPMTGNCKPESHRPRVDALRLPGRARPGGLPASPRGCPRSRLSEGPRAPPLGASKRTV